MGWRGSRGGLGVGRRLRCVGVYRCRVGVRLACGVDEEGFIGPVGADLATFCMNVSMEGSWTVLLLRCPISVIGLAFGVLMLLEAVSCSSAGVP